MQANIKPVKFRPITHVLGQKRAWHDNQPVDIVHVDGKVIGTRWPVPAPPGSKWDLKPIGDPSYCAMQNRVGPRIGWGFFDNAGRLFYWTTEYLPGRDFEKAVAELQQPQTFPQAAE